MDDATLFDEIVRANSLGPRIEDHRLQKHPLAERFTHRMRSIVNSTVPQFPRVSDIFASFIADPEFNAWAATNKGRYFIGVHAGLLAILTSAVFRLLADPRTFSEIGDASDELEDLPTFSRVTPNATECDFKSVSPKNSQRQLFGVHLCDIVFDFILNHELTHIGHGHVGYTTAEYGLPFLGERRRLAGTPAGNLESQAMEMDADFKAAEQVMKRMRRLMSARPAAPADLRRFACSRSSFGPCPQGSRELCHLWVNWGPTGGTPCSMVPAAIRPVFSSGHLKSDPQLALVTARFRQLPES